MTAARKVPHEAPATRSVTVDRRNLLVVGILAAALRLPVLFAGRHLTFDDGVFASSALAMRDGGVPFRQVFSSQGPLFLPLVHLFDSIGLRRMDSPRLLGVISGVALTVLVYQVLRRLRGPSIALYGALAVTISGCVMWVTGPLAADGPALAFAMLAFWATIIHVERPGPAVAAMAGLAAGAAMSVKSIHLPLLVVIAVATLIPGIRDLRQRRLTFVSIRDPLIAGSTAAAVFLVTALPFGISDVWDQTFRYRTETSGRRDPLSNLGKMTSTLWDRDLVLWALTAVTLAWLVTRTVQRRRVTTSGRTERAERAEPQEPAVPAPLAPSDGDGDDEPRPYLLSGRSLAVLWLLTTILWLAVGVNPMWRSHVSGLVPPAVLVLALAAPPLRWLRYTAIACVPLAVVQLVPVVAPGPYRGSEKVVVEVLRTLPTDAWVLSDEPGLAWRSGHRTTDDLVDPSVLRIRSNRYDEDSVVEAAHDERICAVVVRSSERFGSFTHLGDRLGDLGFEPTSERGVEGRPGQEVYLRTDCSPPE